MNKSSSSNHSRNEDYSWPSDDNYESNRSNKDNDRGGSNDNWSTNVDDSKRNDQYGSGGNGSSNDNNWNGSDYQNQGESGGRNGRNDNGGGNDNNWNGGGRNNENDRNDNESRSGSDRSEGGGRRERENNSRDNNENNWNGGGRNNENDRNDNESRSGSERSDGGGRRERENNPRGNNDNNWSGGGRNNENDRNDNGSRSGSDRSEGGGRRERENNSRGNNDNNWNGGGRNNENDRNDNGNRSGSDRSDGDGRRERENNSRGNNDNNWNDGARNDENDRSDYGNRGGSDRNEGGDRRGNGRDHSRSKDENDRNDYRNRGGNDGSDGVGRRGREDNDREGYGGGDDDNRENNAEGDENNIEESDLPKKVEFYIPPELGNEESTVFSSGITTGINFNKFDDIKVEMNGNNLPDVISSFEDVNLNPLLMNNIKKSNYTKPTPIQKYALSILTAQRDLMACAQTGSGKTAAFLIPILNSFLKNPADLIVDEGHVEPQAIIISPTRELAIQIYHEARKFSFDSNIKVSLIYGGVSTGYQRRCLDKGCHIMIATPGRLLDFVNKGWVTFSSIRFVVLDEADRMLSMGFIPAMKEMFEHPTMIAPGQRRTLMFSATFPQDIQNLAAEFLEDYIFVTVGIVGSASSDVEQIFIQVEQSEKRPKLIGVFNEHGTAGTLVFVETKRSADFLGIYLSEQNYKINSIHGDRTQREREEAITDFKTGTCDILVATSVAARGLDIQNVKHVINFDLPSEVDEYVHRVGRTGRIGNKGMATSFYDPETNSRNAETYAKMLEQSKQNVPDWLRSGKTRKSNNYNRPSFGARDVRGMNERPPRSENENF